MDEPSDDRAARPPVLLAPPALADRLGEEGLVLLDTRRGERFAGAHLPGARNFSVYGINTYDTDPAPLRSFTKMWAFQLALAGIRREDTVVVYADGTDEPAARAWWFLEYLGHPRVALLDGGLAAWRAAGLPVERDATPPAAGGYDFEPVEARVATWRDVRAAIGDPGTVLLDTRSEAEWTGRDARGTRRGGAVPGAVHLEWKRHLAPDGRMRPADELAALFRDAGITPERRVIAYCNTGYRSAHACLALGLTGHRGARNYVGSWQEWGNRHACPVVVPEPGLARAPQA